MVHLEARYDLDAKTNRDIKHNLHSMMTSQNEINIKLRMQQELQPLPINTYTYITTYSNILELCI